MSDEMATQAEAEKRERYSITPARAAMMSEWQPIESVPTDGTEFLAYDANSAKMDVCRASISPTFGLQVEAVQSDGEYGPLDGQFGGHGETITHWMPLPAPPNAPALDDTETLGSRNAQV